MISVLIITKNEEDIISDCIKSVKELADEVVVVDDSTDSTSEIAEKLGAKVIKNEFKNFSDQRNYALKLVQNEWIFYLDADERATPKFIEEVKGKMKEEGDIVSGFFVRRKTFYFGKDWNFIDKVERIFKKSKLLGWRGVVHETPVFDGELGIINEPIVHQTHRNLSQMLEKTNNWSEYEARLRLDANHPQMNILRFMRVIVTGFVRSYIKEKGFKNGTAGLIESIYQAYSMFITYAKLWEMQKKS
ncbi:MAG: glycosyltransferase family 2 protein [Candidatus Levybacteria bacterium]|nr:glycosyltransferase family 2 protein [Candidatus Levybacteria bacterium]